MNLKNEPLYNLQLYLQFIESISGELNQFYLEQEQNHEKGLVSKSYLDSLAKRVHEETQKNNKHLVDIERVMISKIRKKFPDVISQNQMQKLLDESQKELKSHGGGQDTGKVVAPNFGISREKTHDS